MMMPYEIQKHYQPERPTWTEAEILHLRWNQSSKHTLGTSVNSVGAHRRDHKRENVLDVLFPRASMSLIQDTIQVAW